MTLLITVLMTLLSAAGCQQNALPNDVWLGKFAMVQTCDGATNPGYTLGNKVGRQ